MQGALALIGRDAELTVLADFLEQAARGPRALILEGEAGIGKSTLWHAGIVEATERSFRVLSCRPVESEAKLSYSAIGDLFDRVLDEAIPLLPAPQSRALEVAMLRTEAGGVAPSQRTVSVAVLSVLRVLAEPGAVLVAIDDAQWLDSSSARVLEFAVRRLRDEAVGVLATRRDEAGARDSFALVQSITEDRLRRVSVGPLSLGALGQVIRSHIGRGVSRSILSQIERASRGNPFFALEMARNLPERETAESLSQRLFVPKDLHDLLGSRVRNLPRSTRDVLLVASMLSKPSSAVIETALGSQWFRGLRSAIQAGLIEQEDRDRVRLIHPLLGSVVYADAEPKQRRDFHRRLADVLADPEESARHLGLAAEGPDESVAAALDEAARHAYARGAPDAAAELCRLAERLTPSSHVAAAHTRKTDAGAYHTAAGDPERARELFTDVTEHAPAGPGRARALRLLAEAMIQDLNYPAALALIGPAVEQVADHPVEGALSECDLAFVAHSVGDTPTAERHVKAAIERADQAGDPAVVAQALALAATIDLFAGRGLDEDRISRSLELEDHDRRTLGIMRPSLIAGVAFTVSGQPVRARSILDEQRRRTIETGEEGDLPFLEFRLAMVELFLGDLEKAADLTRSSIEGARQLGSAVIEGLALAISAAARAYAGDVDIARAEATESQVLLERPA